MRTLVGGAVEPMLASTRRLVGVPEGWVAEPKFDGWRAIVTVRSRELSVRSRRGHELTEGLPELQELVDLVPDGTVLDGELVAGAGRMSDFYVLAPRLLLRSATARGEVGSHPGRLPGVRRPPTRRLRPLPGAVGRAPPGARGRSSFDGALCRRAAPRR